VKPEAKPVLPNRAKVLLRLLAFFWLIFFPLCCIARSSQPVSTSIFSSLSTPAHSITRLGYFVLGITGAIGVTMYTLLIYAIVRYRARAGDGDFEPPQVYGSTEIELSWTIIPILIIITLFLTTAGVIFALQDAPKPANALDVVVVGHQFWWEYRYPQFGVVAANELHIPASDTKNPRPTFMKLTSADVGHSFWVPQLAGKTDLLPNRVNELWIDPHVPGVYEGQCNQLCGVQHAKMLLVVHVDTPEQFDAWVRQQQQPGAEDPQVAQGRHVFETAACMNCHSVRGTVANGLFGPDLTHLMSRGTIAAGAVENTPENLKRWVADPGAFKPGALMPSMNLSPEQLDQLTAYLITLK
jgi:cytochrome c oxidase subunit II